MARLRSPQNTAAQARRFAAAPGHRDQMVSLEAASRYCQTQGAELPTENEMEVGESSGINASAAASLNS